MKNKILSFVYKLNYKLFMKNYILMESNPDFSDNTKIVFDELIKENINKKNKIIWFVDDKNRYKDIKVENVAFVQRDGRFLNNIIVAYYQLFARYIIDCNKYIKKINKNQFRIYLTHGMPIKCPYDYCGRVGNVDFITQISDYFSEINSKLFRIDKSKLISTGFPRNDQLLNDYSEYFNKEYDKKIYSKIILWVPTYRNHKSVKTNQTNIRFEYGVPCVHNEEELLKLNSFLEKNKILLLIKLHPAEDDSKINKVLLNNIKVVRDEIFEKNHSNLYQLLSISDALITDYSSVYYDYLLTKKPIGLAIEDKDEYLKNNEIAFDEYEKNIIGDYIYNFGNLYTFFYNIANDVDNSKNERLKALKKYHKYIDSNSAKRVVEILLNEMMRK